MNEDMKRDLCVRMAKELPLLRKTMDVSQTGLAALAGVSRSTVNTIERTQNMSWNTYLALLLICSKHEDAMKLIRAFDLYPDRLDAFLSGKTAADA